MEACMMATVYNAERQPIGKVKPHRSGAIAAFDGRRRPIGLFVNENLAVMALLDIADKPIEPEIWIEWIEALLIEDGDGDEVKVEELPTRKVPELLLNPW
jgi:hypothetical protein